MDERGNGEGIGVQDQVGRDRRDGRQDIGYSRQDIGYRTWQAGHSRKDIGQSR